MSKKVIVIKKIGDDSYVRSLWWTNNSNKNNVSYLIEYSNGTVINSRQ